MNSTKEEESMRTKIFLVTVGLIGFGLSISAATIPVTTTNPAVAADGQCSLIEAIINANADAATHADCPAGSGADTIELANSATYTLDQVNVSSYGPNGLPIILIQRDHRRSKLDDQTSARRTGLPNSRGQPSGNVDPSRSHPSGRRLGTDLLWWRIAQRLRQRRR